jgi:hypothetical protein
MSLIARQVKQIALPLNQACTRIQQSINTTHENKTTKSLVYLVRGSNLDASINQPAHRGKVPSLHCC